MRDFMRHSHIDANEVDGGAEFNGLYFYDPSTESWDHGDTYLIGFGIVPSYRVILEFSYQHWFPPHIQKMVIMQKDAVRPAAESAAKP